MLYIHNKGNQFQVERDFFEYIDGNSIPYVILCEMTIPCIILFEIDKKG